MPIWNSEAYYSCSSSVVTSISVQQPEGEGERVGQDPWQTDCWLGAQPWVELYFASRAANDWLVRLLITASEIIHMCSCFLIKHSFSWHSPLPPASHALSNRPSRKHMMKLVSFMLQSELQGEQQQWETERVPDNYPYRLPSLSGKREHTQSNVGNQK